MTNLYNNFCKLSSLKPNGNSFSSYVFLILLGDNSNDEDDNDGVIGVIGAFTIFNDDDDDDDVLLLFYN